MERKKRTRPEGSRERERLKNKLHNRRRKGKMKESDIDTSTDSEGYTASESNTESDSSYRVLRSHKKKVKRSKSHVNDKAGAYSDRVGTSRKRKGKKSQCANEEKSLTLKGTVTKVLDASTTDYSDIEPDAVPCNCFGDVTVASKDTYYRSNLKTAIKQIKSLPYNDQHIFEMKKTPFWLLFNAIHSSDAEQLSARCAKFEEDIREIMMTFNVKYNYFAIAKKMMRVTSRDVNLIMGVCGGDEQIPVKGPEKEHPPWICSRFKTEIGSCTGKYVLYKNSVFAKLEQTIGEDDESSKRDVTRLTICYLLAVLLSPLRSAAVSKQATWCLEKMEDIHTYDWCSYVVDMLHSQIRGSTNLKTGGCAILLAFWLCEHTNLVAPVDKTAFPRFLRWDLSDLNERLVNIKLKKMKPNYLRRETLNPTSGEKLVLKELVDFWKVESEKSRNGKSLQGDHTPSISGPALISCVGYETCEEFKPTVKLNNEKGFSKSLAVVPAGPSSSEKQKCSLDRDTLKTTDHDVRTSPLFNKFGSSYNLNLTQDFASLEARERVEIVLDKTNAEDDETELNDDDATVESLSDKNKKLHAHVEILERVVESKSSQINDLKKELEDIKIAFTCKEDEWRLALSKMDVEQVIAREAGYSKQISRLNEELARLRSENEGLLQRFNVSLEQTLMQFYKDPGNLSKIKQIEEQHMVDLDSDKQLVDVSVDVADEGERGLVGMKTVVVEGVDKISSDEGGLAPGDMDYKATNFS